MCFPFVVVGFGGGGADLDLVESSNVDRLDDILEGLNLLLEQIDGHLLVLNDAHDLQLLDAIADWNQFCGAPQQTVHDDRPDVGLHNGHVGLIVPGLHVQQNGGLGDQGGFLGLLGSIGGHSFVTDAGCLCVVFLVVGTKQINIIVVSGGGRSGNGSGSTGCLWESLAAPLCLLGGAERRDVFVPTCDVGTGAGSWSLTQSGEHRFVGLRRDESKIDNYIIKAADDITSTIQLESNPRTRTYPWT